MSVLKEKAQVIMLPTENESKIIEINNNLDLYEFDVKQITGRSYTAQHLYILSDEEIKKGDWYIDSVLTNDIKVKKCIKEYRSLLDSEYCKKIIATTDASLTYKIPSGEIYPEWDYKALPQPSQGFIEKYIKKYNKGNIITDILVEYETVFLPIDAYPSQQKHVKQLKVSKDNTITIHPIKDNWTREELIGNNENSLDTFLLNSPLYTQKERELVMDIISNWIN